MGIDKRASLRLRQLWRRVNPLRNCWVSQWYLVALVLVSTAQGQERYAFDWARVADEMMQHFQALLRIDTTNPPGNETPAAEYLQQVIEHEGISAKLLALEPS